MFQTTHKCELDQTGFCLFCSDFTTKWISIMNKLDNGCGAAINQKINNFSKTHRFNTEMKLMIFSVHITHFVLLHCCVCVCLWGIQGGSCVLAVMDEAGGQALYWSERGLCCRAGAIGNRCLCKQTTALKQRSIGRPTQLWAQTPPHSPSASTHPASSPFLHTHPRSLLVPMTLHSTLLVAWRYLQTNRFTIAAQCQTTHGRL